MINEPNRVPRKVNELVGQAVGIEAYHVISWCPDQDGQKPPEQVWLILKPKQAPVDLVVRFKTKQAIDEMIEALQHHRNDVFGPQP